jgi:hypothetical protein
MSVKVISGIGESGIALFFYQKKSFRPQASAGDN